MFELDPNLVTALGVLVPLGYQLLRVILKQANVELSKKQITWGAIVLSALVGGFAFVQQNGFPVLGFGEPESVFDSAMALIVAAGEVVLAAQAVYHLVYKFLFEGVEFN